MLNEALDMSSRRLCVGVITAPHGVRGLVRVKSFTDVPADLAGYGPLTDADGRHRFDLSFVGEARGMMLARVAGVTDRDAAERLRGTELYIERDALPPVEEEDEFYYADLVGLPAFLVDGSTYGEVKAMHDFGAGTMIEFSLAAGGELILPFTRETVPVVDLENGRLTVDPPAMYGDPERNEPGGVDSDDNGPDDNREEPQ